jgi:shikimate kinase
MVGKTHSGKTTFGKQLMKELEDNAMLFDSDELTDFLMEKYPWLQKKIFPSELPTPL